jgi:hypothetical protein
MVFDFLGYTPQPDGTTTLAYRITNTQRRALDAIGFTTAGWTRVAPANGATYTGALGVYEVRWVLDEVTLWQEGFRFRPQGTWFQNGASETFVLRVRHFDPKRMLLVWVRANLHLWIVQSRPADRRCLLPPTPTNTATATATATATPTATPTVTNTPTATPTSPDSPLPTPTPVPTQEPATEPTSADAPATATPLPDLGVRLGPWQELMLTSSEANFGKFSQIAADGNILVAIAMTNSLGLGSTIVAVDLTFGAVQRLTRYDQPKVLYLFVSESYVVWSEQISQTTPSGLILEELHVYDLNSSIDSVVAQGIFQSLSYKHGIAVWQGTLDQVRGIHGYNVNTGSMFTLEASSYAHLPLLPHVCSNEWVIYLLNHTYALPNYATLYARNLATDENIQIGTVYLPATGEIDDKHSCDNERVIWIATSATTMQPESAVQIELYDLITRSTRSIDLPVTAHSSVSIDGNIVSTGYRNTLGYDLVMDAPFSATRDSAADSTATVNTIVSNDRWISLPESAGGSNKLYIASVNRDQ